MGIEVVNLLEMAEKNRKRTKLINTSRFHAWLHYYKPGNKDDMHCHNQDQTFYMIEGECTMHFPDGGKVALKPGMAALITGGSFYQLENTGPGPMIMMGNRSGDSEKTQKISYETRQDTHRDRRADAV